MAQEQPTNPNTGGQGNTSSSYSEVRAPQFVGGSLDPTTGNIQPSSPSLAASAPPPQTPTTQLATVEAPPKAPSFGGVAASAVAPYVGAKVGSAIGGGASVSDAVTGLPGSIAGDVKSLTSLGGSSAAPAADAAFGGTTAAVPYLGADGATDLSAAPAASTAGGSVPGSIGSTVGGAAGAGIATELIGAALAPGNFVKNLGNPAVYEPAIGSAIGFAIGNVILPGIGGFVGSAIGSLFCHAAGTMILMADGTRKEIERIKLGDEVYIGGVVVGRGEVMARNLYAYRGTMVEGHHAVFEHGTWLRVEDSEHAIMIEMANPVIVYPLVTANHLLVCDEYICTDLAETDDEDFSWSQRLEKLNASVERNQQLLEAEDMLWPASVRVSA